MQRQHRLPSWPLASREGLNRVFVTSLNAGAASEGIISSYLPAKIRSGSEPTLRVVFDPGGAGVKGPNGEGWAVAPSAGRDARGS